MNTIIGLVDISCLEPRKVVDRFQFRYIVQNSCTHLSTNLAELWAAALEGTLS